MAVAIASLCALPVAAQTTVIGPSGKKMHTSKCSQSPNGCYQEASAACSGPYTVLDSYSKAGGLFADAMPGPVTWYYMSYECGKAGSVPSFPQRGQQYVAPQPPPKTNTRTTCTTLGNTINCNSY